MTASAFVLGGTGLVGEAIVRSLSSAGWHVNVGSRSRRGLAEDVEFLQLDRTRSGELESALPEVDVLIDVVPYTADDAEQLLELQGRFSSLVAISTGSVYSDAQGRTFEAQTPDEFPEYPEPIPESQATVEPAETTYSTAKAAVEKALLERATVPVTIVRPGAIFGPGDVLAREWFFVKRALDLRRAVVLSYRGESVFHTTASSNLGELVRLAAEQPGTRILNCGDPDPPNVLEISRRIAGLLEHRWHEELLPERPPSRAVGATPWSTPKPFIMDMTAAEREFGYSPVVTHEQHLARTVEWLIEVTRDRDWREALPRCAEYLGERFDYEAEDRFLAETDRPGS